MTRTTLTPRLLHRHQRAGLLGSASLFGVAGIVGDSAWHRGQRDCCSILVGRVGQCQPGEVRVIFSLQSHSLAGRWPLGVSLITGQAGQQLLTRPAVSELQIQYKPSDEQTEGQPQR